MDELKIVVADPTLDDVRGLVEHHMKFGRLHSPPQDAHALEIDDLLDPSVTLFSIRCRVELVAIGALRRLDDRHAELKTMHTAEHARGQGIGRAMLDHLLAIARERGFEHVSLETGAHEAFAPARSLYVSAGFAPCEPFGDYRQSPNTTYMTIEVKRLWAREGIVADMRLNHITLPVSDVERSADFYVRLGLTQIVADYPLYARLLAPESDTTLSLHQANPVQTGASIHFEVEDVDLTVQKLKQAGFEFACDPVDQPYLWREAILLDPDGHRIFIFHAGENRVDPPWRLRK
ncbi:MAG TPA: GNAT family N-acetyltransferase [Solirubrobacteraceae bacterium]|jgi:putative acetyltransferase